MTNYNDMLDLKEYHSVMSVKEVACALRMCPKTVYKLIKVGAIKTVRFGHEHRIPKQAVYRFLNAK